MARTLARKAALLDLGRLILVERRTLCWREMDSNFWYRGRKAVDFRSIPGIAGVSAELLNDTT
jgi:hypothetical protein